MAIGRNLSRLLLRIEADTSLLPAGLKRAEAMTTGFSKKAAAAFGIARKAALGGAAAIGALGFATTKAVAFGDTMAKMSDAIGITTEELQLYRAASELAGVGTENMDKAVETFAKRLGELRAGTGTLLTFLDKLDKDFKQQLIGANNTSEALDLYLGRLSELGDQADKAAFAAAGFGRAAGPQMSLLVKDGLATLDEYRDRARELGLVIPEDLTRNAEDAQDTLFLLGQVIKVNVNTALLELAPLITSVGNALLDNAPLIRNWIADWAEWFGIIEQSPTRRLEEISARIREIDKDLESTFTKMLEFDVFGRPGPLAQERLDLEREAAELRSRQLQDDPDIIANEKEKAEAVSALVAARQRQVEIEKQQREAAAAAREAEREAARERQKETQAHANAIEEINERLREQAEKQTEAMQDSERQTGDLVGSVESDLLNLAATGDFSAESLRRVFLRAFTDIAASARQKLGGDTGSVLVSIAQGIGALLGPTTGNTGTGSFNGRTTFGGPRAGGGDVRAGVAYRAGEGGQEEIFIPDIRGTVAPASKLRVGFPSAGGGGGANVSVVIHNNTGQPAESSETNVNGQRQVEITIGNMVARDIRNNGPTGQALAQVFALQRGGQNRG